MSTPIELAQRLPRNVGAKLFMYFKHPTAIMIENYYKEPEILKKKWMISQLNRYNWLIHSKDLHCYGKSRMVRTWFGGLDEGGNLARKLHIHDILDPYGNMNIETFIPGRRERNKALKKLWSCPLGKDLEREWAIRCLFGGVYPIGKRPKVYCPRNPWSGKWNLRWKNGGKLRRLLAKKWDRQPWRMCQWEGKGSLVKNLDGSSYVFMGPVNINFVPARSRSVDPYL